MPTPSVPVTGAPFTSCTADASAVALLPHPALDPTAASAGAMERLTQAVRAWYTGTGVWPTMNNAVVPYIYGRCAFQDIAAAIATATADSHRIYIAGWWVDPQAVLADGNPPILLRDVLAAAKGQIRGMFFAEQSRANNQPIVDFLNGLPNGAGFLDTKVPAIQFGGSTLSVRVGGHHQKLVVVSGALGLIAFAGGMDINNTRVKPADDPSEKGVQPWHDVHLRATGQAAADLLRVFRQRWLDSVGGPAADAAKFGLRDSSYDFDAVALRLGRTPPPTCTRSGTKPLSQVASVGVGRTYANLQKFNPAMSYSFARAGEETAWKLVERAVAAARYFIYIEDQYFVSRRLKAALLAKLSSPQFRQLLVLTSASQSFEWAPMSSPGTNEFPYLIAARNEIRADFAAVDPQRRKWQICSLKPSDDPARAAWCGSFVHSKLLIADDECVVVGSANADDRSYTFDSEIMMSVTDDPLGRASGSRIARDLRVSLWHKHLAVDFARLDDWASAMSYWRTPPKGAMVYDNSALEDSPLLGPKAILRDFPDADKQWSLLIDPDADRLP